MIENDKGQTLELLKTFLNENRNIVKKPELLMPKKNVTDLDGRDSLVISAAEAELLGKLASTPDAITPLPISRYSAIGIDQGHMATLTGPEDRFVETAGMSPCIGLVIYQESDECPCSGTHIDSYTSIVKTLDKMEGDLPGGNLKAAIVGANKAGVDELVAKSLILLFRELEKRGIAIDFIRVLQSPSENDSVVFDRKTKSVHSIPRDGTHKFKATVTQQQVVQFMIFHEPSDGAFRAYPALELQPGKILL